MSQQDGRSGEAMTAFALDGGSRIRARYFVGFLALFAHHIEQGCGVDMTAK